MTCKEAVKAENYLNCLIKKQTLTKLKRKGKVVTAQSTTSDRCQISIPQQYCWHMVIANIWEDMRRKNKLVVDFRRLQPHFQLNFDKTCFICCEGTLCAVASADKAKQI
eukprot:13256984-Ditylum_brightwellii.AAC.1